jgi:mannosyltransferase OCH1-like enzyme
LIPKIIHQIWEGKSEPLPDFFRQLGETWKENHPIWTYEYWDGKRMETFVDVYFPEMKEVYYGYKYDVQRWDIIRYMILYKIGGLYADFDYQCLDPFDDYIRDEFKCYFSMEPEAHNRALGLDIAAFFNNALMVSPPGHPFFKFILDHLRTVPTSYSNGKFYDVLVSTGPLMLSRLYNNFSDKTRIELFPSELVSPWSQPEVRMYVNRQADEAYLEKRLEKAIAIHFFEGGWTT